MNKGTSTVNRGQRGCRGQLLLDLVDHGKEQLRFHFKCIQMALEVFEQEL